MKLHHFCRASDLDSIAEKGLYPHVPYEPVMSLGLSVISLTTAETTAATEEYLEHYRRKCLWIEEEIEETRQHGWLLDTCRTHRLTVRVRSDHKLLNYGEFLRQDADTVILDENKTSAGARAEVVGRASANDAGELYSVRHMMENLTTSALTNWFICFGRISPSKIYGLPPLSFRTKQTKKSVDPEDSALDRALNKFIKPETATWMPPEASGRQ
jgi:hypothetical protein